MQCNASPQVMIYGLLPCIESLGVSSKTIFVYTIPLYKITKIVHAL